MTAFDKQAASKWHASMPGMKQRGLSGAGLEKAIAAIAHMHPDLVDVVAG